jgi:hypothetical protein
MTEGAALPLLTPAEQTKLDRDFPRDPGHFRLFFDPQFGTPDIIELQEFDYATHLGDVLYLDDVKYPTEEAAEEALDLFEFLAWQAERRFEQG